MNKIQRSLRYTTQYTSRRLVETTNFCWIFLQLFDLCVCGELSTLNRDTVCGSLEEPSNYGLTHYENFEGAP